jgi:cytoskeletal protein CcmA (bactofilin family)
MSVFNRNEKQPETMTPVASSPPRAESTPSVVTEPRRAPVTPVQQAPQATRSVISKSLKITGQLESTEDIQIEGEVEGDVRGLSVKIGSGARIKGTVFGDEVELAGAVDGKIEAKKVILCSTARMSGDVIHSDISIQSGAYIDGHCRPEFGKAETRKVFPVKATGS